MSPRHVTAAFAGAYLSWHGATRHVSVDLIRQWAHRNHVTRVGTDLDGYALYDLDDVIRHAKKRGIIA